MFGNLFFKSKGKEGEISPRSEFIYSMDFVRQTLEYEKEKKDQIIILNYMLDVVRNDLKYDLLTTILYSSEYFTKEISLPFPSYYYDEQGNEVETDSNYGQEKDVDLSENCVLVLPWNRDRLRNSIKNIYKNEFKYHSSNHLAYYYTHVDICYAYNGLHSISSGIGHKKGFIKASERDVSRLFNHVHTDGLYWFNAHNNEKIGEVFDFRIAILYELAKIKYKLENSLE